QKWRPPPLFAQIFQQQIAAERIADDDDSARGQPAVEPPDDGAQIFAAAGVVTVATALPRGAGAAQVETQHGMAAIEQMPSGRQHIPAVCAPREAVNEDEEWAALAVVARAVRAVECRGKDVTGAVGHRAFDRLGRMRVERERPATLQIVADRLQVTAPPGRP